MIFRQTLAIDAVGIGSAQNRYDADARAEQVLQENHLKFDGVFDRVAVILHQDGVRRGSGEFVHDRQIGLRFAEGRDEGFAGEAEAFRRAVMRRAEDHERSIGIGGRKRGVGGSIGRDAAERADVRRGDREDASVPGGCGAVQIASQGFGEGIRLIGIAAARVNRRTGRRFGEGPLRGFLASRERFILEKSGGAQRVDQVLLQIPDLQIAGDPDQILAQIEISGFAVEKFEAFDERRRNDERCVGVLIRIANHQTGTIFDRGREKIKIGAKPGKQAPEYRSQALESRLLFETPLDNYSTRLKFWRDAHERAASRYRQLGNARLLTGLSALAIAAISIGGGWISPWWLIAPLVVFIALAVVHDRVDRTKAMAQRGLACYELALSRLSDAWVGKGNLGERFRDPKHIYADDLDLFGRGSIFELISTARTAAGENTLARWLMAPGERGEVVARQESVEELRSRVDLREELALMGDDIRAAVDAKILRHWGDQPPVKFFSGARVIAFLLAIAALATLALFLAHVVTLVPFLLVILVELMFNFITREAVRTIADGVETPAHELGLLTLLLERLERESFSSPRLMALKQALETDGLTASEQIRKLSRWIATLDTARHNQFFRPIGAPLLWISQVTMGIEQWRQKCGPNIGKWTAAIGEFEALCSVAGFAYERPKAVFPELVEGDPQIDAEALNHPLIPPESSIANDVKIGGEVRLWIVSGSNMSGKSTLMRAIGLNAVLAWAGAPVTCGRMRISRLHIGASMRTVDSLVDHRSRFYAEIERLRDIVNLSREGQPTLFLLDELLSGTNSHDRRIGAEALVRGLVARGAIGLVTTHDLALADIAETFDGRAVNVHFEDHIEGGEILFDYRLRPGIVTRSNALELMRAVGLEV